MEKLLTVNETASILRVSVSAIYKWIDEHRIEYIDLGADGKRRCIRIRPDFVERLIKEKSNEHSGKDKPMCYTQHGNGNRLVERKD